MSVRVERGRTLQWRVGGEEGRSGTITGSRKQDGGWSLLLPLTLCLHPLLPQPQARTKHGTAAHFTPPTFDLLYKDGTMPSNKVQYQCYFVCTRRQQKNSFCENISRPCPVLPHAVQLGWGRDCFRVYPLSTIYISTQYLPCP